MKISLGAKHDFIRKNGSPNGWRQLEISKIADVIGGATPNTTDSMYWNNGSIPWATPTDITSNNSKYISRTKDRITQAGLDACAAKLLPKGTILFTSRATIGAKAIADVPMATNQGFANFVPREIPGDFLYYLIDILTPIFKRLGSGTTFDEVNKRDIRKVWCAIPIRPEEQEAVARILDTIDMVIEQTRAAVDRARALQISLTADSFDRQRGAQKKLAEYITDIRYGTSQAAHEKGWGNPTLRIPNVVADEISYDELTYVNAKPADVTRLKLIDGDLLLVRTNGNPNYVGRSAVFKKTDDRIWLFASYLIRVRLDGRLKPDYVNIFLGTERGRRELLRRVTTSAGNHNINANSIRLIKIPVPESIDEQDEIIKIGQTSRTYTNSFREKLFVLEQLKKALMHDLLTGKVRVNHAIDKILSTEAS